jgi:SagB-type dehydrogenase family enzyme
MELPGFLNPFFIPIFLYEKFSLSGYSLYIIRGIKKMKKLQVVLVILFSFCIYAQSFEAIKLPLPDTTGGLPVMKAFAARASERDFDKANLTMQEISNLLWAANGINRHQSGKRTAPSAMNSQDVDVYAVLPQGTYLYNALANSLDPVAEGDYRALAGGSQKNVADAPLFCLLVSDISRFKSGDDSSKIVLGAMDAGIVSQNISIYCASAGLATVPRATMDQQKLKEVLKLEDTQHLMLNHPVGYRKK